MNCWAKYLDESAANTSQYCGRLTYPAGEIGAGKYELVPMRDPGPRVEAL